MKEVQIIKVCFKVRHRKSTQQINLLKNDDDLKLFSLCDIRQGTWTLDIKKVWEMQQRDKNLNKSCRRLETRLKLS